MKYFRFIFSLSLVFLFHVNYAQFPQKGKDVDGEVPGESFGYSISMSSDGNTMAIGAPLNDSNGPFAGCVKIYRWGNSRWHQKGQDLVGETAGDLSGTSVSISSDGNTVAIGAPEHYGNGTKVGHIRIFSWDGTEWIQKGQDIEGTAGGDQSGTSVSISSDGNIVIIGAPYNDNYSFNAGNIRVYRWTGSAWTQKGQDIVGEAVEDYFGHAVSISSDGNTIAIGAPGNDSNGNNAGRVRVYSWNGSLWVQTGQNIDGETIDDESGWAVKLSNNGNTIAIGAPFNDGNAQSAGHVRVYTWNSSTWVQKGQDIDGEGLGDLLGRSVSLSSDGNTVAIGAPGSDGTGISFGYVKVYNWSDSVWVQIGQNINGEEANDWSGVAVSTSGNGKVVAIGAYLNDGNAIDAGHVRTFRLKGITGLLYMHFDHDCIFNSMEIGLSGRIISLQPENIVLQTSASGYWSVDSLPTGTYILTADTLSANWNLTCPVNQSFTITNPDSLYLAPAFGYISTNPCPAPDISIQAPVLRPGFSNQKVYVQACNEVTGTGIIDSAYVIVSLDSLLTVQTASLPYTSLGNNQYQFNVGDINPGFCVDFSLDCHLSSNAMIGQTLCLQADLYPVDTCALDSVPGLAPCPTPWDGSSLRINGFCKNDSIYFIINNAPQIRADMSCYVPVRLYIDGQYVRLDSVQLLSGESKTYAFAGDGRTWRMEVDQHPLHPGNSNPSATVEACGNLSNWTPGLVTILPQDDAEPIVDIFCGEVRGSYDPNDKRGFPKGVSDSNYILPNQQLQYVIRFQNTGTDTAFTVVIRDTLDTDLNIFTVVPGVSSHEYEFQLYGPRVLEWTFHNILLPDSNVNEPASHGFVTFHVEQNHDLPNSTIIENSAAIYFDFNAPIITNQTSHTVNDGLREIVFTSTEPVISRSGNVMVYPNPATEKLTVKFRETVLSGEIRVLNILGEIMITGEFNHQQKVDLDVSRLADGIYFLNIRTESHEETLKVVRQ